MRTLSLAAAVTAAVGGTTAAAAPPTAPSDLRVDVYSDTAAELFWSRSTDPDGLVRGYEIRRGGELLDTRDGLSYFTDDLSPGLPFSFTVTAVDFDGERSEPARVRVVGGDREGAVGSGGGRPPPPANLRAQVYSSSAAELFWDRADQRSLTYEVSRNGRTVVTTDGTSAFLSGLPRTDGVTFDVVAIDSNGRRSGAATVTLGGDPNPPGPGGDAPAAPSNLRAEVYSSSAGEVFWDRVSGTRLEYEVSLDGEVAATTTGTSYFVGSRPGIDGTRVEVVAIDPDGTRSSASSTTLGDGGSSSPDPGPGTDGPPAPANARIEVYSSTAAELFFDRAPASANVVETEISRDGEVIGTTNGTSFFDPNRAPGRDYVYELVAVDASGNRSSATTVGEAEDPPEGSDLPTGIAERLDTLFTVANGEVFEAALAFLDRLDPIGTSRNETPISSGPDPDPLPLSGPREVFPCPDGGTFAVTVGTEEGNIFRTTAEDCTIGDTTVDGTYLQESSQGGFFDPINSSTEIEDYRLVDARTGIVATIDRGDVFEIQSQADREGATVPVEGSEFVPTSWDAEGLSVTGGDEDYALSSLSVRSAEISSLSGGEFDGLRVTVEGLSSALYDDASIETVATLLRDGLEGRYTVGSLQIVDGDRAETLDADGGDPEAFLFTVEDGGTTTSYAVPWSDRFDFERVDDDAEDIVF